MKVAKPPKNAKTSSPLIIKIKKLFHTYPWLRYAVISIGLIIIAAIVVFIVFFQTPKYEQSAKIVTPVAEPVKKPVEFFSKLTGEKVANEAEVSTPVIAIMIENSPDARPQSGLKKAGVVFEAIAEGGITRFVTLYQNAPGETLIGPVRSLRPYYIAWAKPFQPAYAHVGGSALALSTVRSGGYRDIDQFFNAGAYWRTNDRYAPHNVYTTVKHLDDLQKSKGFNESKIADGFVFKDDKPSEALQATSISVNMNSSLYSVSYAYDKASNSYLRSEGGEAHIDRENGQITPKNVVVIKTQMTTVQEDGARESYVTNGSGEATVFRDGQVIKGTWNKANDDAGLTLTDESGKPIELNRGQTWVTAINQAQGVSWQ